MRTGTGTRTSGCSSTEAAACSTSRGSTSTESTACPCTSSQAIRPTLAHARRSGHAYPVATPGPNKHTIPSTDSSTFLAEFAWPGTQDFSAIASLPSALAFRRRIGGESAIMTWCDELARQGGRTVASMWKTEVMESEEGGLTGPMVNVRLPLDYRPETVDEDRKALTFRLLDDYNCFAVSYVSVPSLPPPRRTGGTDEEGQDMTASGGRGSARRCSTRSLISSTSRGASKTSARTWTGLVATRPRHCILSSLGSSLVSS